MTALTAKATNPHVDMLSLQIEDDSDGAYAPRTLCYKVVYPFQKKLLGDALGGSNNDPLVNKPARYPRLLRSNAARGDGKKALDALCDYLPQVATRDQASQCLDYLMSRLLAIAKKKEEMRENALANISAANSVTLRPFLSNLLDQGFGGAALVLVTTALYEIQYPKSEGFEVVPHPVNQTGSSSHQLSDLDLYKNGLPFLGSELKDKTFSSTDVAHAADTALAGGLKSLLFIAGRQSGYNLTPPTYFTQVRNDYSEKGLYIGITGIDALLDIVLSSHPDVDSATCLSSFFGYIRKISGTPEIEIWVYNALAKLQ